MNAVDRDRRRLLQGMGIAAGAAAAVGSMAANPTVASGKSRPPDRIGIAIVGLGGYARFALERLLLARWAYPAALVSGSADRAREWALRYGVAEDAIYGYDDYARMGSDHRIDAVHICLPVGLHAEHTRRALLAGKHVLCEKPIALTSVEAAALIAEADSARRILMPAYRAWFSDAVQELRTRIRDGSHGSLTTLDTHKGFAMTLPADNWRFDPALAGGGCLFDIGIYSVQLQRWLAGELPRRVSAFAAAGVDDPRFRQVEPDLAWIAEFDDGVLATGTASWRHRLQNRVRVGLSEAWLDLDPATPAIGERLRIGVDGPVRVEEIQLPLRDQIPRMYDAFAESCLGRREQALSAREGWLDLVMMEALYTSAAAGAPVRLSETST